MNIQKYLLLVIVLLSGLLLLTAVANFSSDPYGAFSGDITPVKQPASSFESNVRMAKAHVVREAKPAALILGSSRAEIGFSPAHAGWRDAKTYNLGLPSAKIEEVARYFEHAVAVANVEQVVVALDLFQFNPATPSAPDYRGCRLYSVSQPHFFSSAAALCDVPFLWLSAEGLSAYFEFEKVGAAPDVYLADGSRDAMAKEAELRRQGSHSVLFFASEVEYLAKGGLYDGLSEVGDFALTPQGHAFEELLTLAHQNNTDLRLLVSPSHARQWELQDYAGLSVVAELWKRYLVETNRRIAEEMGAKPFPLWDFANYNEISQERVLEASESGARMQWYWESSHFTRQLGNLILDQVLLDVGTGLGRNIAEYTTPELNAWIFQITRRKAHYRLQNAATLQLLKARWPEPYVSH